MPSTAVKLTFVQWRWNVRTRPDSPPALSRRERSRREPALGPFVRRDTLHAKRLRGEVAVTAEVRAGDWGRAIRYDSLGLNKIYSHSCQPGSTPLVRIEGGGQLMHMGGGARPHHWKRALPPKR
jgi:hypothetical protein